jgi:hypothetical protein
MRKVEHNVPLSIRGLFVRRSIKQPIEFNGVRHKCVWRTGDALATVPIIKPIEK